MKVVTAAAEWCGRNHSEVIDVSENGWSPREEREDNVTPVYAPHFVGDLDGDGRRDAILNLGVCGDHASVYSAYVQCPDGGYSRVMEAECAAGATVVLRGQGWADIKLAPVSAPGDTLTFVMQREGYVGVPSAR